MIFIVLFYKLYQESLRMEIIFINGLFALTKYMIHQTTVFELVTLRGNSTNIFAS